MPHPSGPNAYPSSPGFYPSSADVWQASAAARNDQANPCLKTGNSPAWAGYGTSTSLARSTGLSGLDRATGATVTNGTSAAGTWVAADQVAVAAGQQVSATMQARPSAACNLTLQVWWIDNTGAFLTSASGTTTAVAANTAYRPASAVTGTAPSGAVAYQVMMFADSLPASATLTGTACRSVREVSDSTIGYADEDTIGWSATGASGTSPSTGPGATSRSTSTAGAARAATGATTSTSPSSSSGTTSVAAAAASTAVSTSTSSGTATGSVATSTSSPSSATASPAAARGTAASTTSPSSATATAAVTAGAAATSSSPSASSGTAFAGAGALSTSPSTATGSVTVAASVQGTAGSSSTAAGSPTLGIAAAASSTSTSTATAGPSGPSPATASSSSPSGSSGTASTAAAAAASTTSPSSSSAAPTASTGAPLSPVVVAGRARIYCRSDGNGNPWYSTVQSAPTFTLANSSASVQAVTMPAAGGATNPVRAQLVLTSATAPTGRRLVLAYRADLGVLQFRHEYDPTVSGATAYTDPNALQVAYDPALHAWWRIRHDGTKVFFETSPDNWNWASQREIPAPAWAGLANMRYALEAYRFDGTNDYAEFDNVNGPVVAPPPPAPPTLTITPPGPVVPQTPIPRQRLLVADTITGRVGWELPTTQVPTWATKLNDIGTLSATLVVEEAVEALYSQGARNPADALTETLDGPNRFTYVMAYGNQAVWAGPMQPSVDTSGDQPTVGVGGSGIESLLNKRIIMGYGATAKGGWADASRDINLYQTNPAAVVYQLVQLAITNYPTRGDSYQLPIFCSRPPTTQGDENFTYLSYDTKYTWDAIKDLTKRADGPDVRFVPVLTNGPDGLLLSYDLQIGAPYLTSSGPPGRDGPLPWVFDDRTSVVQRSGDAVGTASTYFSVGSGQDRDKIVQRVTSTRLTRLGFPAMEQVDTTQSSQTDPYKVTQSAQGQIAAHETPTETWTVTALNEGLPPLGSVQAGDQVTIDCRRHWRIPPGTYTHRVTSVAGGNSTGGSSAGSTFDVISTPDDGNPT